MPGTLYYPDHLHLNSLDPSASAAYYERLFGAQRHEWRQLDGQLRTDVNVGGLQISISKLGGPGNYSNRPGICHFGLQVDDLDGAVNELVGLGADLVERPRTSTRRPNLRLAFVRAPDEVGIELLERR
jgi:catechol 2,3-dioxygenase-like lactoylglutathione lyase family enzyme